MSPGRGAPQRPDDQYRLEEQSHEPGSIGVETECVGSRHELGDVSGKDHHEEGCRGPADRRSIPTWSDDECGAQQEFEDTRNGNHRLRSGHPRRNLREEGFRVDEVTDPRTHQ